MQRKTSFIRIIKDKEKCLKLEDLFLSEKGIKYFGKWHFERVGRVTANNFFKMALYTCLGPDHWYLVLFQVVSDVNGLTHVIYVFDNDTYHILALSQRRLLTSAENLCKQFGTKIISKLK